MYEDKSSAKSVTRRIKDHILRIAFAIVLIIVCTEIILRLFIISPTSTIPDEGLGWKYRPHAKILNANEGYSRNTINSAGLNDEELRSDSFKQKIIVLGDSYTEALQVSQSMNFTSIAEQKASCLDVLNAGQAGRNPVHYPLILERLATNTSFDKIVVVFSASDLDDLSKQNFKIAFDKEQTSIMEISLTEKGLSTTRLIVAPLLSRSSLLNYLKQRLKKLDISFSFPYFITDNNIVSEKESLPINSSAMKDVNRIRAQKIFTFILKEIRTVAPTYALYLPSLKYHANGFSSESTASILTSEIVMSAAEATGIPFRRVNELAKIYRDTLQPPIGFNNSNIKGGHLNSSGHRATAIALLELIGAQCSQ